VLKGWIGSRAKKSEKRLVKQAKRAIQIVNKMGIFQHGTTLEISYIRVPLSASNLTAEKRGLSAVIKSITRTIFTL
jgi:hypothetical protein